MSGTDRFGGRLLACEAFSCEMFEQSENISFVTRAVWLKLGVLTVSALQYLSMAVTEDRIAKAVAYYRKKLDARPHPPESLSQAPDSQLQVIVKRAGAQRRSSGLLVQLEAAFKDAGILTFPPLTDPFLKSSDRVRMLDANQSVEGLALQRDLFSTEKELQGFIWARREHINEFRKRGLTGFQEQGKLDSGRRVDILCKRPSANQLVAIELKAAQPDDRSAGQIQQYIDDLDRHAKAHGYDSAHLIVISGQPDKSVRHRVERFAQARGLTVEFLLYRVQTKLLPHP
ncbi:hypothetical protein NGTWS0302_33010 [Mycolicibacterium cyprinidarum]|uniref:DUF91 domain-containing protein n=1 Tax=Mycolicibacterium cyprinidarum TaxID=2860311 RepID=A0ABQ4V6S1_9MYCO|nr:hypothetical protein NGTWS1702_31840 [Mycolicibacterium sp. NGTWSNA01]GJF13120.1 hypothetical protein NGTWS0302_33010 [Mycolicibacterium sp. NGTWS0302]